MEQKYHRFITKAEERKLLYFEFDVPENVERLEISYDYLFYKDIVCENGDVYREDCNIVDLALEDETGLFRGGSGSNKKSIYITENHATPSYLPAPIGSGMWRIILGAYVIQDEGCMVDITVNCIPKQPVLLRGDLHMHTVHSDGSYTPQEQTNIAKLLRLDFIAITDHFNFVQNEYIMSDEKLTVIPGMEMTHFNGHCGFLGVKRPINSYFANTKEEIVALMNLARKNGAMISLNHAIEDDNPWLWGFDVPFDTMEAQNGFYEPKDDLRFIAWWQEQLVSGRRIPIIGGSDNHRIRLAESMGTPTTCVYADSHGASDIIKAMKAGHAFLSCQVDGPVIEMKIGMYILGDVVPTDVSDDLEITVSKLSKDDTIKVITNTGEILCVPNDGKISKKLTIKRTDARFYRVEVWRGVMQNNFSLLGALSNPIYIGDWS